MKKIVVPLAVILLFVFVGAACAGEVNAKAAILIEFETGRVLFEKNADERLPIASTTKIMTCLLALENASPDQTVTAGKNASGVPGTSIYLSEGETLSMSDMLYGLMLRSGNDCAVAIAEHISGSVEAFASLMNMRAEQLGANAYFTTPNGLDEGGNGASARGIALIAREAMKNEDFRDIVKTQKKTIPWKDHQYERVLTNKNRLLKTYDGALGIKTGFTSKAGRCLVFAAEKDGMTLIGAVLSCPDWFDEAEKLLDYGFENYSMETIVRAGENVFEEHAYGQTIRLNAGKDICLPLAEGEKIYVQYEKNKIDLPIYEGEAAGKARVFLNDNCVYETDLVYEKTIEKMSFAAAFEHAVGAWPVSCVLRGFYSEAS